MKEVGVRVRMTRRPAINPIAFLLSFSSSMGEESISGAVASLFQMTVKLINIISMPAERSGCDVPGKFLQDPKLISAVSRATFFSLMKPGIQWRVSGFLSGLSPTRKIIKTETAHFCISTARDDLSTYVSPCPSLTLSPFGVGRFETPVIPWSVINKIPLLPFIKTTIVSVDIKYECVPG